MTFKSSFHTLLQTRLKHCGLVTKRRVDCRICVYWRCSTKQRKHLCGTVRIIRTDPSSAQQTASSPIISGSVLSRLMIVQLFFFNPSISPQLIASESNYGHRTSSLSVLMFSDSPWFPQRDGSEIISPLSGSTGPTV